MQPDSYTDHQPPATPLERAQAKREEIRQIAEESAARIRNARDYEAARLRYEQAIDGCRAARERATEADRGRDRAEDELAAAVRGLRQFETSPGIALPQYRQAVA